MESLSIRENLIKYRIAFDASSNNEWAIWCPFCKKMANEIRLLTFNINQETGIGQCQECSEKCNFEELSGKLGMDLFQKDVIEREEPTLLFPHIWTVRDILSEDFGQEEWLVKDLIPLPSMTAMSGIPGNFKTWITIALAQSIAEGKPFLEQFSTHQGAVLMVDEENHIRHIQKRLLQLNVSKELPIFYLSRENIKIDDPESYNYLLKIIESHKIKLVIFDSLVRIHTREENDAKQMAFVMNRFMQLVKNGVSVLFTHHHRKQAAWGPNNSSQSLRGSSDILAAVDCHLTIEKVRSENTLVVCQEKLRTAPITAPFNVTIENQSESIRFVYAGIHDHKKTKTEEAKEAIVQLLEEEQQLFREDFHERLTMAGKQAIDAAIKDLQKEAIIELVPKEDLPSDDRKKNCYRLIKSASQFPTDIDSRETGKEGE